MRTVRFVLAAAAIGAGCSNDDGSTARTTAPGAAVGAADAVAGVVALQESRPGLLALAAVTEADARAAALARVPGGRVIEAELEEEAGRLVYSYDITADGERGVMGVEIDAKTGRLVSIEHEDGEDELEARGPERDDDEDETPRRAKRGS